MVRITLPFFSFCLSALSSTLAADAVTQVHLGFAASCPYGISVSFASSQAQPFSVKFGDNQVATSTATTYSDGNYKSPHLHTADLCKLTPRKTYPYSIGSFQASFVAPPAPGDSAAPTVLGIVGDMDFNDRSLRSFRTPVNGHKTQAILVAGDWTYANGKQDKWDKWFDLQVPTLSTLPTTGINGNHEVTVGGEKYKAYLRRVPGPISETNKAAFRTYYAINVGLVHAVFLDDYVGSQSGSVGSKGWLAERNQQLEWLQKDLAAVDRTKTPYVIVIKHNPFYNTFDDHQCVCGSTPFEISNVETCWAGKYKKASSEPHCGLQAKLEDVCSKFKVNVVFAGHCHAYERTHLVFKNKVDKTKGIVYVTTGAGGRGHGGRRVSSVPQWSAFAEGDIYGTSRIIATRTNMQVLWVAHDNMAKPLDAFTVLP
ncbi:hypothetical protein SDRG_07117 [Saprolegnia diclina VS20]|uniref:Purple acid phosphatase n=1 Tax=Saprolegnia diclina (strain VS20) TaxID=1156394 RepID=T0RYE6_SAPDV|nr:hypothetical protein SDRG_07117 [Saprolegnia diclina VS20]EQC35407.1 hypothetical protein SDRG_07117 [Saprolegnia diclina VS20]|eukprot:XP_008611157.1 hypothetical protein SDRG_07117 [Saprolegnia diclina VS20]